MYKALKLTLAMGISLAGMSDRSEFGDFETGAERYWQGPHGGGEHGGTGSGAFVIASPTNFVHGGDIAARLEVRNSDDPGSVAWSCMEQVVPCTPRGRLHVNAWFYSSSSVAPLAPAGATAQLRVEYFSDEAGTRIIPTRVVIGPSFGPAAGSRINRWQNLSLQDRVPEDALSMKLSIVLVSQHAGTDPEAVWVDDVTILQEGRKKALRPNEKAPAAPAP